MNPSITYHSILPASIADSSESTSHRTLASTTSHQQFLLAMALPHPPSVVADGALARFHTLLTQSRADPTDCQNHFDLLTHINSHRLQHPHLVIEFGKILIEAYHPLAKQWVSPFSFWASLYTFIYPSLIRERIYDIIEQVCYAAIQCHMYTVRNDCLYMLEAIFGGSTRVKLLRGQIYESAERFQDALGIYTEIIKNNASNLTTMTARQRIIAIYKSYQDWNQVLILLEDFVKVYSSNFDGWYELTQTYVRLGRFDEAAVTSYHIVMLLPESCASFNYSADIMMMYAIHLLTSTINTSVKELAVNRFNNVNRDNNSNSTEKITSTTTTTTTATANTTVANKKLLSEAKSLEITDSIAMGYDTLQNARHYYATSHHISPNQIAAMGLIATSKKILSLLQQYPDLLNFTPLYEQKRSQQDNAQHKTLEQALLDSRDLIALSSQYLLAQQQKRCEEQTSISKINLQREQKGQQPLPVVRTFDHFAAQLYYSKLNDQHTNTNTNTNTNTIPIDDISTVSKDIRKCKPKLD